MGKCKSNDCKCKSSANCKLQVECKLSASEVQVQSHNANCKFIKCKCKLIECKCKLSKCKFWSDKCKFKSAKCKFQLGDRVKQHTDGEYESGYYAMES